MDRADWGASYSLVEVREALRVRREELEKQHCTVLEIKDDEELCRQTV